MVEFPGVDSITAYFGLSCNISGPFALKIFREKEELLTLSGHRVYWPSKLEIQGESLSVNLAETGKCLIKSLLKFQVKIHKKKAVLGRVEFT